MLGFRMAPQIVFCTGNKNKLKEFKQILGSNFPYEIVIKDVDLPEYQGEPEEIAHAKCKEATQHIEGPVIVEDTSLCYNALGGLPGPYIKWFLKKMGTKGLYKLLDGFEDKSAYSQCIFAYSAGVKDAQIQIFSGRCEGEIVEPRGSTQFGWDPVFQPKGFTQTFAEMDEETKNTISHRYNAMVAFKEHFMKS